MRLPAVILAALLSGAALGGEDPLARAQAHLNSARYAEAERAFVALAAERPTDPEVLRGLARTAYWSGDWRAARRRFRALARFVPGDAEAREALAAFDLLGRPALTLDGEGSRDDQPARVALAGLTGVAWLDPLTSLRAETGLGRISADDLPGGVGLTRARAGISAKLPAARLALSLSAGALKVDGCGRFLLDLSGARELGRTWRAEAGLSRGAALDSDFSYRVAVPLTQGWLRVSRPDAPWTFAAEARGLWYGDGNAGLSAWAWSEGRLFTRGILTAAAGAAAAWRDTRETRTRAIVTGVVADPEVGFRYAIRTVFDPYVTPERQLEGRVLAHLTAKPLPTLRLDARAEWGAGRERATGWGPAAGPFPVPPALGAGTFARSYHPWRAALSGEWSGPLWGLRAEGARTSSAFYTVSSLTLSLRRTL